MLGRHCPPSHVALLPSCRSFQKYHRHFADPDCVLQAASSDWLSPVADGLQTVLVFIQSGLEQVQRKDSCCCPFCPLAELPVMMTVTVTVTVPSDAPEVRP